MDFEPTEEQRSLQALCRDLAKREIEPNAADWYARRHFPVDLFRRFADLGLMGLLIPEQYGGSDVGALTYVVGMEEVAAVDNSVAAAWNAHLTIGSIPFLEFGTDEQRRRWLMPLAKGEVIGAFGLTEPGAGSDAAGVQTRAVRDGDEWVLNGSKIFISNSGTELSYGVVVLAATGEENGRRRFSSFVVPIGTPGYTVGRRIQTIGWRAMDTRELSFQDCRIPADHLLGEEGRGLRQFMATLDVGRVSVAALSLGLARGALEAALAYAKERVQFGQPISKLQAIQFKLADMATEVELARLITHKSAWLYDRKLPHAKEAAMAKLYASEAAMRCADEAVQIHGGYGFTEDYAVSRFFRDAKVLEIGEGSNEIQHLVIARLLGC